MSTTETNTVAERVALGVQFLDENEPGWEFKVSQLPSVVRDGDITAEELRLLLTGVVVKQSPGKSGFWPRLAELGISVCGEMTQELLNEWVQVIDARNRGVIQFFMDLSNPDLVPRLNIKALADSLTSEQIEAIHHLTHVLQGSDLCKVLTQMEIEKHENAFQHYAAHRRFEEKFTTGIVNMREVVQRVSETMTLNDAGGNVLTIGKPSDDDLNGFRTEQQDGIRRSSLFNPKAGEA